MRKRRIAILGGGMAGLTTAFELTRDPASRERIEVTVYQQGWRLGGKGASGRNRAEGLRIEEHGLHVWMGFYENAFRVMRACYAELGRSWRDAFAPHHLVVHHERVGDTWRPHVMAFPPNDATPGDGEPDPSPLELARRMVAQTAAMHVRLDGRARRVRAWLAALHALLGDGSLAALRRRAGTMLRLVARYLGYVRGDLPRHLADDDGARRLWIGLDLLGTTVRGMIADGLLAGRDFSELDDEDFRDWLRRHGAAPSTVDCAPVRSLYDLVFSREAGLAAGTTLACALRMLFSYKGAIFWTMRGGMGDVVIAPLYEVLRARGVRFELFHRVDALRVGGEGVAAIEVSRQATPRGAAYEPLIEAGGAACWPSEPRYDQLVEGEALRAGGHDLESHWCAWRCPARVTLRRGADFDDVVLAIPVGALPHVAADLLAHSPRLRALVEHTPTTATRAMQLWLRPELRELGWPTPPPVSSAYAPPFDTWADLSHLLRVEQWPAPAPRHLAYLCGRLDDDGPLPPASDTGYPARVEARVRAEADAWLDEHARGLWPAFARDAVASSYVRANVNPTDRYVQTVPGSTRYRLGADESGFDNVVLAGDWVRTRLNAGCIEAAVMAGLAAARALGADARIHGEAHRVARRGTGAPSYIERGGDLVLRGPYAQHGARLVGHVLPARLDALDALVARYLDAPLEAASPAGRATGSVRYRAAAPFATLVCADIASLASLDPHDRRRGTTREREVGLWVPVAAGRDTASGFVAERLVWFLPYLFVDNAAAVATGREVYGFPKQHAAITGGDGALRVSALAFARHGTGEVAEVRELISVRRRAAAPLARPSVLDAARTFRRLVLGRHASPAFARQALRGIAGGEATLVFLQQLRDVADPARASWQAILEAPARATARRSGGLVGAVHEVAFARCASHPIVAELGLAGEVVQPTASFELDLDFVMERGRVVWCYPPRPAEIAGGLERASSS